MVTLTIDVNNIINENNLKLLKDRVKPVPKTASQLALILSIPTKQLAALQNSPIGKKRVEYINTPGFVEGVKGYAYVTYDRKKRVCEIIGRHNIGWNAITDELLGVFPSKAIVWVGVSMSSKRFSKEIKDVVKAHFSHPHISQVSPSGKEYPSFALCMVKLNGDISTHDATDEVLDVLSDFAEEKGTCKSTFKIEDKSIKYMKQLHKLGSTLNSNGTITQKEVAGSLWCTRTDKHGVQILEIDQDSLIFGQEEGVVIVPGLYNFHSHPRTAYDTHKVKVGWPSAQDYVGFLLAHLEDETILHLVVSIEGIYVLSINRYWLLNKNRLRKNMRTFILENYNLCGRKGTPYQYVRIINQTKYKDESPLFLVMYVPWKNARDTITINYKKSEQNCFVDEKTMKYYDRLYK